MTSLAAALCRQWVRFYTRKLPEAEALRRREEIESDLFEHADDARRAGVGHQRLDAEVLARVLVGVPADLSWRRATRQPHTRLALGGTAMQLPKSTSHRLLYALTGLIVLYGFALPVVAGSMSIFTDWDGEPSVLGRLLLFGVPIVSTTILVIGLVVQTKNPRRGLHLIIPGAIGPAIWYWMLPLYAPLMIAVIALAIAVTPRKRRQIAAT